MGFSSTVVLALTCVHQRQHFINGTLSKSAGSFKIDHPLDPDNKWLYHSFVESPDMMNVYNGNIVSDANGEATVTLPSYFEALNKRFPVSAHRHRPVCPGDCGQRNQQQFLCHQNGQAEGEGFVAGHRPFVMMPMLTRTALSPKFRRRRGDWDFSASPRRSANPNQSNLTVAKKKAN